MEDETELTPKKGRPKGSKNKPKRGRPKKERTAPPVSKAKIKKLKRESSFGAEDPLENQTLSSSSHTYSSTAPL